MTHGNETARDSVEIIIVMPVYDDWEAARMLCAAIDDCLAPYPRFIPRILLIDDGSGSTCTSDFFGNAPKRVERIQILKLRRNLGHQRAIAVALAYVQQKLEGDVVIVMDADGEDRPQDIHRLIEVFEGSDSPITIFAERGRRVESLSFKLFYGGYRLLHRMLTGRNIRFGNFSLLPWEHVNSIVAYPELWNHYAAAVLKARLPYATVRADRGERLGGKSKMNFVSLVIHGLSALFASYEVVSTRLLLCTAFLALAFSCLILAVVGIRLFTHLAIPGWATFTVGLLFILVTQSIATLLTIVFSVMMNRNSLGFLPIRDYEYFVRECVQLQTP
jgi:glycosyltransferase involved in cell wall biosynthesis